MAAQKEKMKKPGYLNRALAFFAWLYRLIMVKNVEVTGIGTQQGSNYNIFFKFKYDAPRRYSLKKMEVVAKNRYNLKRCTILDLVQARDISFTFSLVDDRRKLTQMSMDKIQYLELA